LASDIAYSILSVVEKAQAKQGEYKKVLWVTPDANLTKYFPLFTHIFSVFYLQAKLFHSKFSFISCCKHSSLRAKIRKRS